MEEDEGGFHEFQGEALSQPPCEICGSTIFGSQGGFYYCSVCNTQSQQTREYVEDEGRLVALASARRSVGILGRRTKSASAKKKSKQIEKSNISWWESLNMLLKQMTDKLIRLGFPQLLEDKVFQLWISYLHKRQAILCEDDDNPNKNSRVTVGESKVNLAALFNWRKPRRKRKKKVPRNKDDVPVDAASANRVRGKSKRKAFEVSYMETVGHSQEDHEAIAAIRRKNTETHARSLPMELTRLAKRAIYLLGKNKNSLVTRCKDSKLSRILKVERFKSSDLLTLLFIACRQIGCRVLLSDFSRLVADGTLYVDSLSYLIGREEGTRYDHNIDFCFRTTQNQRALSNPYDLATDIQAMINYLGIKKFQYPHYQEFLPKFVEDFGLPREFEALLSRMNKNFDVDDDLRDMGENPDKSPWKIFMEMMAMSMIVIYMYLLFGLDDVTEIHQSRFAVKVNEILSKHLNQGEASEDPRAQWSELFDIGQWFEYIRFRKNFVEQESQTLINFSPGAPPNLVKANDVWVRFGKFGNEGEGDEVKREPGISTVPASCSTGIDTEEMEVVLETSETQNNCYPKKHQSEDLRAIFRDAAAYASGGLIHEVPDYISLPLPFKSILDHYNRSKPNVSYTDFNERLLSMDFTKKRIDFIYNPEKYIPLLNKAGYKVKVIAGTATNCGENLKLKSRTLYLFQPFAKLDKIHFGSMLRPASLSMDFVFRNLLRYIIFSEQIIEWELNRKIHETILSHRIHPLFPLVYKLCLVYMERCKEKIIPLRSSY